MNRDNLYIHNCRFYTLRRVTSSSPAAAAGSASEMTQGLDDEQRARVARRSALRRLPEVDDVAGTVALLLGDGAKNIAGTLMTVDAGSTA
jgi:3-oxoacyl-[acyl-carrier protein] reductase